ncbi:MAG: type III pantothenate kinase, partial [Prolixibacteraceae bacterium]|nr:type III pantothenate kinase [Prolixibacteraceae bacterium]
MNLIIDIGNTRTKVAIFKKEKLLKSYPTDTFNSDDLFQLKKEYPKIKSAIVSSVKNNSNEIITLLKEQIDFVLKLNHKTILPIENLYRTPKTLGKDRIAAAVGANKLYPNKNLLVIDAGTAITYDFVNNKNQYLGGFITPGLNMRLKALNEYTDKLPLIQAGYPDDTVEGNKRIISIKGGIQFGLEGEIRRIIQHFKPLNDKLT